MKKLYFLLSVIALPLSLVLISYSSGSTGGLTGSPGDGGATCTQCHTGSATNQNGWITTNVPLTGYIPGETYTITATGTHSGVNKFGFELTAENTSGEKTGEFALLNSNETRFTGGNQSAITHTLSGTTPNGNSKTWTMEWTAPQNDEGDITFYASFNAANGNGTTSGDVIYLSETTINQSTVGINNEWMASEINLYPNPVDNYLNIEYPDDYLINNLQVFNTSGQLVKSFSDKNIKKQINFGDLEKGMYYLRLSNNQYVVTRKVLKK